MENFVWYFGDTPIERLKLNEVVKKYEDDADCKDDCNRVSCVCLLSGHTTEFISITGRKNLVCNLTYGLDSLTGTVAFRSLSVYGDGGEEIESGD